jgi:hypothetical protein
MGRIAKWVVKLMGEGITYAPQKANKSQVLADLMAEWTKTKTPLVLVEQEYWTMYFDGSLMEKWSRGGTHPHLSLGIRMRYIYDPNPFSGL